jgi:hypothetical protein
MLHRLKLTVIIQRLLKIPAGEESPEVARLSFAGRLTRMPC